MSEEKSPTVYKYTFTFLFKNGKVKESTKEVTSFEELEPFFAQAQEWIDRGNGTVTFRGHTRAWGSAAKWPNAVKWLNKKLSKALVPV